jgi:hypothetical protein
MFAVYLASLGGYILTILSRFLVRDDIVHNASRTVPRVRRLVGDNARRKGEWWDSADGQHRLLRHIWWWGNE